MPALVRQAALFALLCALSFLSACAGTGSAAGNSTSTAGKIVFRDYQAGREMTLISSSMLADLGYEGDTYEARRLAYYSEWSEDSSTTRRRASKACHDDAIAGLLQALDESGLGAMTTPGPAAPAGQALGKEQSFEITVNGRTRHVTRTSSQQRDLLAFTNFMTLYVEVYNAYQGYNSVQGRVEFEQPTYGRNLGGNR
ncbi:MAG: hypothetical protein PVJ89_11410 [Planctomycetota bacterium]|jgi:hypothetical protein